MYVKVLYDNGAKKGMVSGWGFSCLIDGKYLFDTGETASSLMENKERMMVSISDLEGVIISHEHYDHTGGIWEVLKRKKAIKVYACSSFSDTFKECIKEAGGELILVDKPMKITDNLTLTGELGGTHKGEPIAEQSIIVNGEKGVSVITGCAHPGILKILSYAKKLIGTESFYMVFGGFHLQDLHNEGMSKIIEGLKKIGIEKIGPTHCTGERAKRMIRGAFNSNYISIKAGHVIQL
jgi:7,8-dihydropterin-6-yl-methyl-4-(beta-D-ribofuranosyl)aminobenzene 5'-phosphate synthase